MDLRVTIPIFLKNKLDRHKLYLAELSRKCDIPYPTLERILNGAKANPDIKTLIKIADYFQCFIDEIVGRDLKYLSYKQEINFVLGLTNEIIKKNLIKFITQKIHLHNTTLSRLSLNMGFGSGLLSDFIREDRPIKSLRTYSICRIADYFDIPIDEMIGRVSHVPKKLDDYSINND